MVVRIFKIKFFTSDLFNSLYINFTSIKNKGKREVRVVSGDPWTAAYQAPPPMGLDNGIDSYISDPFSCESLS